jgi:hypothetical protein
MGEVIEMIAGHVHADARTRLTEWWLTSGGPAIQIRRSAGPISVT